MASILEQQTMVTGKPQAWRWTREQYYRIADMGLFEGKRVELINGEIIEMSPMTNPHWVAVLLGERESGKNRARQQADWLCIPLCRVLSSVMSRTYWIRGG